MRNITTSLYPENALSGTTFTLNGASSAIIDIDTDGIDNLQIMSIVTYATTSSTTGLAIDLYPGIGSYDNTCTGSIPVKFGGTSSATFADNAEHVALINPAPSQGSPQTRKSMFYLNDFNEAWPRWVRMQVYNRDSVSCTLRFIADA